MSQNHVSIPRYTALPLSLLMAWTAGCGPGTGDGNGTLNVSLTDAPACGFDHVYVTVTKVRAHMSSSANDNEAGWSEIVLDPVRRVDLLDLTNGILEDLGQTPLAAGHYTQLRLVLGTNTGASLANSVVVSGSVQEVALDTPSAERSGTKLLHEFDVASGQRVDLVLDFDACRSVVSRGNNSFLLKPVIKVVPFVLTGITGFVDLSLIASHVVVSAQVNGVPTGSTKPNNQTGEFYLARLSPGPYDVVLSANGCVSAMIAGVLVPAEGSTVTVSTESARIALPASPATRHVSGNVTLHPAESNGTATVEAMQSFPSGHSASIRFQVLVTSAAAGYWLPLPDGAPLYGEFGAGALPVAFAPHPGSAGKYSVEASQSGYATQSHVVDISLTDATHDFVLVP
jgi:hypothetical protein